MEALRIEKVMEMFNNEVNVLTELDHPNIIRLIEVFRNRDTIFLVTEFC